MTRLTETEKADALLREALDRALCAIPWDDEGGATVLEGVADLISEARSCLARRIARTETARRTAGGAPLHRLPGEICLW